MCFPIYFIFFVSGKTPIHIKNSKASYRDYDSPDDHDSSPASRRSTYRINMPMKVAKLILPQITNKNQETIIRIYPDESSDKQNQTGRNYLLSLSYKKINDNGIQNTAFQDCMGGCCCCPGSKCISVRLYPVITLKRKF